MTAADVVTVTGGAAGFEATAAWFEEAARLVDLARTELDGALDRARALDRAVDAAGADSPATALGARLAVEPLLRHRYAIPHRAADLADLAGRLRAAAASHRAAERLARQAMGMSVHRAAALGTVAGELGPGGVVAGTVAAWHGAQVLGLMRALRPFTPAGWFLMTTGERLARDRPWLRPFTGPGLLPAPPTAGELRRHVMPFVGAWIVSVAPGAQDVPRRPVRAAAAGLAGLNERLGRLVGRDLAGVTVTARTTVEVGEIPATAAGLLALVQEDQPGHGGAPGQVSVRRIEHAVGPPSWLVTVPGTQDWGLGRGSAVLDLDSNLRLVGDRHADSVAAVTEAMTRAGVGHGDDVVLAGHSQGGLVAADLALALQAAGHAGALMAVTAGSPVGAVLPKRLPDGVDVLSYGHSSDGVMGLQAGDMVDDARHTHVERDLGPLDLADPMAAHALGGYVETAGLGEADPSVAAAEARLAEVLGVDRGIESVTWQSYVAERPGVRAGG